VSGLIRLAGPAPRTVGGSRRFGSTESRSRVTRTFVSSGPSRRSLSNVSTPLRVSDDDDGDVVGGDQCDGSRALQTRTPYPTAPSASESAPYTGTHLVSQRGPRPPQTFLSVPSRRPTPRRVAPLRRLRRRRVSDVYRCATSRHFPSARCTLSVTQHLERFDRLGHPSHGRQPTVVTSSRFGSSLPPSSVETAHAPPAHPVRPGRGRL
jgi:hypothetical protein